VNFRRTCWISSRDALVFFDIITMKCNFRVRQNLTSSIDAKSYSVKFRVLLMRQSLLHPFYTHSAGRNKLHTQKSGQSIESTEIR
jgi:hypothetical protein